MNKPLLGQTVLVTGASGDIGGAIVRQIAGQGGEVIIHYSRDKGRAEHLLASIGGAGHLVCGDLGTEDGPLELWHQAMAITGRIDALVNNAGVRNEVSVEAAPAEWQGTWRREFQINFFAAADLCKEAIIHFRSNGGGRIVNMASRAGQRGYSADAMQYGASKAALINLTKSIATSFGADGITAVAIAPGWVGTEMAESFMAIHGQQAVTRDIPIGRAVALEELAELVAFVLRPSQRSLNGATLDINGGSYIR